MQTILQQKNFDLILLDRLLPDGDSIQMLESIKAHHSGIVMFLTALGQVPERISGINAGADYYIQKPVNFDELMAYIEHFDQKRMLKAVPDQTTKSYTKDVSPLSEQDWVLKEGLILAPNGKKAILTMRDTHLIELIFSQRPNVVNKSHIIQQIGHDPQLYDLRRLDSAIYRIRKKVLDQTELNIPIKTYHRVGFVWAP